MNRLHEVLSPNERALCEKLAARRERRGEWFPQVVGLLLVPAVFWLAASDDSGPALGPLILAFAAGGLLGVFATRWIADRREAIVARLYAELARSNGPRD